MKKKIVLSFLVLSLLSFILCTFISYQNALPMDGPLVMGFPATFYLRFVNYIPGYPCFRAGGLLIDIFFACLLGAGATAALLALKKK